jgi:enterochelin esterase family protein
MKSLSWLALVAIALSLHADEIAPAEPEVAADGRVTFRLRAPSAREVRLQLEGLAGTSAMQKDAEGVWSFVTPALEPDLYGYSFQVDGLRAIDLNNPLMKYNLLGTESMVHVPGPASLPWEINDVPHGELHRHFYRSAAAGDERDFYVYTPPGYEATRRRYPVLYLLHGYSDDASAWTAVGRENVILDNLIARGEAKPMVVVMPLGYGTMEIVRRGWSRVSSPGIWERNVNQFRATLLDEVLPQVEKSYRVSRSRKDRAVAGLSMGGAESLLVGLNDLDRFAWIGAFSSGGLTNFSETYPALDSKANERLRLLWISCGKDDRLNDSNRALVQWLGMKDVHCTWTEVPGVHSWTVWRRNLAAFAPLLFR